MAGHVVRDGGTRVVHALLGIGAGAVTATAAVVAAVVSFDVNPVGPALVALVAVAAGVLGVRRVHDPVLRGAAVGLIVGGAVAVLLWPLFSADTGGGIESPPAG
jgi:hypothetical protein